MKHSMVEKRGNRVERRKIKESQRLKSRFDCGSLGK